MAIDPRTAPWKELDELLALGDVEPLVAFLRDLPADEAPRAFSRLHDDDRERLLSLLPPALAADFVESLPDAQASAVIEELPPETAAAILDELRSDDRADMLTSLPEEDIEEILEGMDPAAAQEARQLARFPARTAGGLMSTEVLEYAEDTTVGDVVADLRRQVDDMPDRAIQYVYVNDEQDRLAGVLRMRDLLLSPSRRQVGAVAVRELVTVRLSARLNDLAAVFDQAGFLAVPVIDRRGRLMGIVHRAAVEEALFDRDASNHLKSQGIVGGEEFRSMPLATRSLRRLSWLSVNVLLNVLAASIIAFYQDTLSQVIALAVFLPIISDMSGCSGNQAVAVSMRELALGLVKPYDLRYVWLKEMLVGLINGVVLGTLIALVAWAWKGNVALGVVVGAALAVNTVVAVSIGGTVPLLLRRVGFDPALASGPILTTITDMVGFLLVLGIATAMLPQLVNA